MRPKYPLAFSTRQRNEIVLYALLIIGLQWAYFKFSSHSQAPHNQPSTAAIELQNQIDSLKKIAQQPPNPPRSFNPNFINDFQAFQLGLSPEQHQRLQNHRAQGKWVNSAREFQNLTQISDSLLAVISPQFRFPEWVTQQQTRQNTTTPKTFQEKIDINQATAQQLQKINGVGEVLSNRIIRYRERLNGFATDQQLHDVFGLEPQVVQRIKQQFTVKTPPQITKINLNTASASDLATLPFINFELAASIIDYRWEHQKFESLDQLKKVHNFPIEKIEIFKLYLSVN